MADGDREKMVEEYYLFSDWDELCSSDDEIESTDWILIKEEEEEEEEEDSDQEEEEYDTEDNDCDQEEEEDERKVLSEVIKDRVLPYLPAKSLLRFKSLSRQWNLWISSPLFIHTHSLIYRSISGLFFHTPSGFPSFTSFGSDSNSLPDPSLSFLPEPVHIKSSTHGLVCCRGRRTFTYYVCNPITTEWAALPPPINDHDPDTAVVIAIQEPLAFNFSADYYIICAYEIFQGIYAFETFSSEKWAWSKSNAIVEAERIVSGSGVAVAGSAYWRTTMQSVVAYNPEADAVQEMACPVLDALWEIGELGRRLCCVNVKGKKVKVLVLKDGSRKMWRKVKEFTAEVWGEEEEEEEEWGGAVPLRAQGEREVVVWEGRGRRVVARDVVRGGERTLVDCAPEYCADFVPYISSLVRVRPEAPKFSQN